MPNSVPTRTSFKLGHTRSAESIEKQRNTMMENYKNNSLWKNRINKFVIAVNTPDVNKKKGHTGSNHPMWISDRKKLKDRRPHNSPEHRLWRKKIFERDFYTCVICKKTGGKLQAHHIKMSSKYPELRNDINNGVTLCLECHKLKHRRKNGSIS